MAPRSTRDESARLRDWRTQLLVEAGMSAPVARGVAADLRYDVHALLHLLEQGCPEPLALRIVAPDDALPLATQGREVGS